MDTRKTLLALLVLVFCSQLINAQTTDTSEPPFDPSQATGEQQGTASAQSSTLPASAPSGESTAAAGTSTAAGTTATAGTPATAETTAAEGTAVAEITTAAAATTAAEITTTAYKLCPNPEEFPLTNNGHCISRSTYTGIFISSIVLACVAFLLVIGLTTIIVLKRSSGNSSEYGTDDDDDSELGSKHSYSYEKPTSKPAPQADKTGVSKTDGKKENVKQSTTSTSNAYANKPSINSTSASHSKSPRDKQNDSIPMVPKKSGPTSPPGSRPPSSKASGQGQGARPSKSRSNYQNDDDDDDRF